MRGMLTRLKQIQHMDGLLGRVRRCSPCASASRCYAGRAQIMKPSLPAAPQGVDGSVHVLDDRWIGRPADRAQRIGEPAAKYALFSVRLVGDI